MERRKTSPALEQLCTPTETEAALQDPPRPMSLTSLRIDRLSYLADLISELQVMAHETQCHTLAGILGLAHSEARQQIRTAT